FSSRRRHTRFSRDWSSDVCSSDLKKEGDPSRIPLEKFSNNMRFMIETLQARGIRVILMATNGYRPGNQDFQHRRLLDYIHEAEKLANTYNTGFVNKQRTY